IAPFVAIWSWIRIGRFVAGKKQSGAPTPRSINCLPLLAGLGSGVLALATAFMLTIGPNILAEIPRLQRAPWYEFLPMLGFAFIGLPISFITIFIGTIITRRIARRNLPASLPIGGIEAHTVSPCVELPLYPRH